MVSVKDLILCLYSKQSKANNAINFSSQAEMTFFATLPLTVPYWYVRRTVQLWGLFEVSLISGSQKFLINVMRNMRVRNETPLSLQ